MLKRLAHERLALQSIHVGVNVCVSPEYLEHPLQIWDEEGERLRCTANGRGVPINQGMGIFCTLEHFHS